MAKPGSLKLRKTSMKMWEEKARRETKTEKDPKKIQTYEPIFFFSLTPAGKKRIQLCSLHLRPFLLVVRSEPMVL